MTARLLGLRTNIYKVTDLAKAKAFYKKLFGIEPYFDEPFYVGFNIGGFELGLDPDTSDGQPGPGGSLTYWGVASMDEAMRSLKANGATIHSEPLDVGDGIKVASIDRKSTRLNSSHSQISYAVFCLKKKKKKKKNYKKKKIINNKILTKIDNKIIAKLRFE